MNIPAGIRNIIFDLGGVVMDLDIEASRQAFVAMGFDGEAFHLQRDDGENIFVLFETGKMDERTFLRRLRELLPGHPGEERIREAWNRMIVGFREEKIRLLQALRERYRTFLLSNTNSLHVARCNELLRQDHGIGGLDELFEETFYSYELGLRKPTPEIFRVVLERKGLQAGETLFIDDSREHLAAAEKLGIVTRWMERNSDLAKVLGE